MTKSNNGGTMKHYSLVEHASNNKSKCILFVNYKLGNTSPTWRYLKNRHGIVVTIATTKQMETDDGNGRGTSRC